ncbi:UDP-N-acetylglucosamine 2-epimerase (non-hydrolyzing) [bacterium (Candidatus Blackallbacteria) CG17_big_fil_post_rev_8_21_14_2_50_48_46]|uniref:UDP-N-acetylglucosamine 2-epimerase (Non-hydrolyzing) n=1 Tax=bacterium (Candidatus Blackallbacteria) CG17_big_fil_post_rev_8_21_14_2_50_48_46 TaxID=2014261 RepID=A0A2M7GAD1_9BACT|nr:MAG: UDP-N-acetylglucosamine 2-epimerase (non-hydrolyzing) [bacterium (Candidatus Blackallbacteria) CG18_big_fil_WC_8_21_14_2_50_49_26]PIW19054.1 MAG: UDP-N-acetylglucosamine 2-epimerase (non-hydrolyzing) [bacterium (Candidatus Blackallbacteria) CG17_big_fil_post_rev_8_21_14_2_50_48_46]PIW44579.1 MAG: UDP-N-acetylglucosamine 2-epimerase (non-hydrolyzing) [bacterium (Candidatus Blackallbacteria) CG13_big_fil_rev_8_21_14_2_50_49_14]
MKIMTLLGTRPEIIRLSLIIPLLDQLTSHVLVHTGQNYDARLNAIFFEELGLRAPDHVLETRSETPMQQVAKILSQVEAVFAQEKPDRVLILGDTNSGLGAYVAKRQGIPVYHMEAGNRCYNEFVPEEVNRRVIDHCSDMLMPYTERSRQNLLREGVESERIYVTGNPIKEVLDHFQPQIAASTILETLKLKSGEYFLVTLHREENVDNPERFSAFLQAFESLWQTYHLPLICSLHPRTRSQLQKQGRELPPGVVAMEPLGLFDFVALEKQAFCVLSDSGTVQEECALFKVPSVTLRDVTERPETLEVGSNFISGATPEAILLAVRTVLATGAAWNPPPEYLAPAVSQTVARIVLGNYTGYATGRRV